MFLPVFNWHRAGSDYSGSCSNSRNGWLLFWRDKSLFWQIVMVFAAWVFLFGLHYQNNGLWFQGDAPRHASTGIFWKDFFLNLPSDPKEFALSYYARYPVIDPVSYPPVFHLLEAAAYGVLGPSPYVAKGLVLCFALMASLYTIGWLRRWITPEAGWAGALVLLAPGMVVWSHAVMLNVPSYALEVGALYHAREWLDSRTSRHFYLMVIAALLAVFTYYQDALIAFVLLAWIIVLRRWYLFRDRRVVLAFVIFALLLLPSIFIIVKWAPVIIKWLNPRATGLCSIDRWIYYPRLIPGLAGLPVVLPAILGAFWGLMSRRWRKTTLILLIWLGIMYVALSFIEAKDARYVLPAITPLVCLCMISVFSAAELIGKSIECQQGAIRAVTLGVVFLLIAAQAVAALKTPIHSIKGFKEAAKLLGTIAPGELVLYDGNYEGVFTFNMLAIDRDLRGGVVLAAKLPICRSDPARSGDGPSIPQDQAILETLRTKAGCRWLAVLVHDRPGMDAGCKPLRDVLKAPQFKLVKSLPIVAPKWTSRLDIYRLEIKNQRLDYRGTQFQRPERAFNNGSSPFHR